MACRHLSEDLLASVVHEMRAQEAEAQQQAQPAGTANTATHAGVDTSDGSSHAGAGGAEVPKPAGPMEVAVAAGAVGHGVTKPKKQSAADARRRLYGARDKVNVRG